jgi:hypothetical protein
MALSLDESLAVNEIAGHLYGFLPGNPHPYAAQDISFPGAAREVGLSHLWIGGSKRPAIARLLEQTLETRRDLFCPLILVILKRAIAYRSGGNPITRDEIVRLNELLVKVHFKIPELWDIKFLDGLPREAAYAKPPVEQTTLDMVRLRSQLIELAKLPPQPRGYAFEAFLRNLFEAHNLAPRGAFRLVGEQIDGSFQYGGDTYLLEAKWQAQQTREDDLIVFRGKVENKSQWSRGLFVSDAGFSDDGLEAFSKGRATNIIGMSGQDLYHIVNSEISLTDAIAKKVRLAAETGRFFVPVFDLIRLRGA